MYNTEIYTCANGTQLRHIYSDTFYLINESNEEYSDVYDPIDSTHTYIENLSHKLENE